MKNKKSQSSVAMEFLMTYGWAILAAIVVIGFLAYFGVFSSSSYQEQHFKTYKEECEPRFAYIFSIDRAEELNISFEEINYITYGDIGYNHSIDCPKGLRDCFVYEYYDYSCEEIEVDEIVLKDEPDYLIDCGEHFEINDDATLLKKAEKINQLNCEMINEIAWIEFEIKTISKQDLSIEWLEENCECLEREKECYWFGRTQLEDCNGIPCCCNAFNCKNLTCQKYKCEFDETYFVETWNQLK